MDKIFTNQMAKFSAVQYCTCSLTTLSISRVDHACWIEAQAGSHPHSHAPRHCRGHPGSRALPQTAPLLPLPLLCHCHPANTDQASH